MPNREYKDAEYQALQRVVEADRRYRRFMYLIGIVLFVLIVIGGFSIKNSISHKIDDYVRGSISRGEQRQEQNKTIARESIRYNTCLLVINPALRTPEVQERCFKVADLPGGLSRDDFSPLVIPASLNAGESVSLTSTDATQASPSSNSSVASSSPQNTTTPSTTQPDNSQPPSQTSILQPALQVVSQTLPQATIEL